MYNFSPLHNHSDYSLMQSTISIDKLIEIAKANNFSYLALTDFQDLSGIPEFIYKCKQNSIKPIIGMDLEIENYYFTLIAKNYEGYKYLCFLSSKINLQKEKVTLDKMKTTNVFLIDHPKKGYFAKKNQQLNLPNYFVGTTKETFANTVYFSENKVFEQEDMETLKVLNFLNPDKSKLVDLNQNYFFPKNIDLNDFRVQQAIEIAENCNVVFPENKELLPVFPKENSSQTSLALFAQLVKEKTNFFTQHMDQKNKNTYQQRVQKEFSIIKKLGFIDYFLIIQDVINWAKKKEIKVGPGRGSAVGSLIAFLLNITEIDPLKYDLIFERFLNPERISLPDIDIDIADDKRDQVIDYVFTKYGFDKVSLISTYAKFGAKTALRDVARFLKIDQWEIDNISKTLKNNQNLTYAYENNFAFQALINKNELNKKLFSQALKMETLIRQRGTHAAGLVISNLPIFKYAPIVNGQKNLPQLQYPMDFLEKFNLLKIDFLGLKNLSLINKMEKNIQKLEDPSFKLKKIPLNDPLTNNLLSRGNTNGVFQLESRGMQQTLRKIQINSLDELTNIISLFRPGPIDYIETYFQVKNKYLQNESISKEYNQIVKNTNGIIIYQEQIMQIVQKVANLTYGQADILRRAISKKNQKNISKLKTKFVNEAIKNHYEENTALKIYEKISKFANYGFNKSHGVAYATLAYQMAFLKSNYPKIFYACLIDSTLIAKANFVKYVQEAKRQKIKIISPKIHKSQNYSLVLNNEILLPLTLIKGITQQVFEIINQERKTKPFQDFQDFVSRAKKNDLNDETIFSLVESNSLSVFGNTETLISSFPSAINYANMIIIKNEKGEKIINSILLPGLNLIMEKRDIEKEVSFDLKYFNCRLNAFETSKYEQDFKINNLLVNQIEEIIVLIKSVKIGKTKNNQTYAKVLLEDSSCEVLAFAYESKAEQIEKNKTPFIAKVKLKKRIYNNQDSFTILEMEKR